MRVSVPLEAEFHSGRFLQVRKPEFAARRHTQRVGCQNSGSDNENGAVCSRNRILAPTGMTEEELAALVTRGSMIGVAQPSAPAPGGPPRGDTPGVDSPM